METYRSARLSFPRKFRMASASYALLSLCFTVLIQSCLPLAAQVLVGRFTSDPAAHHCQPLAFLLRRRKIEGETVGSCGERFLGTSSCGLVGSATRLGSHSKHNGLLHGLRGCAIEGRFTSQGAKSSTFTAALTKFVAALGKACSCRGHNNTGKGLRNWDRIGIAHIIEIAAHLDPAGSGWPATSLLRISIALPINCIANSRSWCSSTTASRRPPACRMPRAVA
jgi:hypothetical protein